MNLKKEYQNSLKFLKESKKYFYFTTIFSITLAIIVGLGLQNSQLNLLILEKVSEIILAFQGLGLFGTILKIFLNNSFVSLLSIISGVILGIFPVLILISNSYMIGFVSEMAIKEAGFFILWKLIPHGIFEIPAILISTGLGIKLGFSIFDKRPLKKFEENLLQSLKTFILIIIPLLIVASIIEGILIFIT